MFTRPSPGSVGSAGDQIRPSPPKEMLPMKANHMLDNSPARSVSVISKDLRIVGDNLQVLSESAIHIDGEVQGEVRAREITIGEGGIVTGLIVGDQVTVGGRTTGTIRGKSVSLEESARVEGEIFTLRLAIAQGAVFDGTSRRLQEDK